MYATEPMKNVCPKLASRAGPQNTAQLITYSAKIAAAVRRSTRCEAGIVMPMTIHATAATIAAQ